MKTYRVVSYKGQVWEIKARSENHAWRLGCAKCGAGDHITELHYVGTPEGACNA